MDALTQMFRAEVEGALRRRLACYAPQIEVDWSNEVGAAGPHGLATITYRGDVLDADDPRMFDPRCDAQEAILAPSIIASRGGGWLCGHLAWKCGADWQHQPAP